MGVVLFSFVLVSFRRVASFRFCSLFSLSLFSRLYLYPLASFPDLSTSVPPSLSHTHGPARFLSFRPSFDLFTLSLLSPSLFLVLVSHLLVRFLTYLFVLPLIVDLYVVCKLSRLASKGKEGTKRRESERERTNDASLFLCFLFFARVKEELNGIEIGVEVEIETKQKQQQR